MCCNLERVNEDKSGASQVDSNESEGHTRRGDVRRDKQIDWGMGRRRFRGHVEQVQRSQKKGHAGELVQVSW